MGSNPIARFTKNLLPGSFCIQSRNRDSRSANDLLRNALASRLLRPNEIDVRRELLIEEKRLMDALDFVTPTACVVSDRPDQYDGVR